MKTITNETYLRMPPDVELDFKTGYRVEYTPTREPNPEDRVLWIMVPRKHILEIISKMDSSLYTIRDFDSDCLSGAVVQINISVFPRFEEEKIRYAAELDEKEGEKAGTFWDVCKSSTIDTNVKILMPSVTFNEGVQDEPQTT
jgi:hypothetical protein